MPKTDARPALKDTPEGRRVLVRYAGQMAAAEDRMEIVRQEREALDREVARLQTELADRIQALAFDVLLSGN